MKIKISTVHWQFWFHWEKNKYLSLFLFFLKRKTTINESKFKTKNEKCLFIFTVGYLPRFVWSFSFFVIRSLTICGRILWFYLFALVFRVSLHGWNESVEMLWRQTGEKPETQTFKKKKKNEIENRIKAPASKEPPIFVEAIKSN